MKNLEKFLLIGVTALSTGCIGWNIPQPFQSKPYTYVVGGDQIGRDTLQNRVLVANHLLPIKGFHANRVLTILGQPQQIKIVEREVAEDWYFVYYKKHVAYAPKTVNKFLEGDRGTFLVRIYNDKAIDVVSLD